MQSLQDESPSVRANAARTLGFIGAETAVSALGQTLPDQNRVVRQAAAEALRQIGREPALDLLDQQSSESSLSPHDNVAFDPIGALIGTLHLRTTDLSENHDAVMNFTMVRNGLDTR